MCMPVKQNTLCRWQLSIEHQRHAQNGEILNVVLYVQWVKLIWGGGLLIRRERIFSLILCIVFEKNLLSLKKLVGFFLLAKVFFVLQRDCKVPPTRS